MHRIDRTREGPYVEMIMGVPDRSHQIDLQIDLLTPNLAYAQSTYSQDNTNSRS